MNARTSRFRGWAPSVFIVAAVVTLVAHAGVVEHSGTISQNTTFSASDLHRITGRLTVNAGITLTIEPGAILKFNYGASLTINGVLQCVGTEQSPIVFTSYRDDSVGGDTNGDGPSEGQPGDWTHLYFADTVVDSLTRLEYTTIRYGGGSYGNVYSYRTDFPIRNCTISDSKSTGIYLQECSPLIESNTIERNGSWGLYIAGRDRQPTFRNNVIRQNVYGIGSHDALPIVEGNTIMDNQSWGLYWETGVNAPVPTGNTITGNRYSAILPAASIPHQADGNVLGPNEINGLWVRGMTRSTDLRLQVLDAGQPSEVRTYQIYGRFTVGASAALALDPGVILKFVDDAELQIDGALAAVGSAEQHIVFTSYRDDEFGGDFNHDGTASIPYNGIWRGIYFTSSARDAECVMDYTVIRFGGRNGSGNIYSYRCDFSISNSVISNSSVHGVRSYQASLTLTNCDLFANDNDGLRVESTGTATVSSCRLYANLSDGIDVYHSAGAAITNSQMFGNLGNGVRNNSSATVTAAGNWWGSPDGPSGSGPGTGDGVSAGVVFDDFLTEGSRFSYFNAGGDNTDGTLVAPTVSQGTGSSEWGAGANARVLYDPARVILTYAAVDISMRYDLISTYNNPDATDPVGGNWQSLEDGAGRSLHLSRRMPSGAPTALRVPLPPASYAGGDLQLNLVRENGARAVVSQVWLVQAPRPIDGDPPTSQFTDPAGGETLNQAVLVLRGTSSDGDGSGVRTVEIGIDDGSAVSWRQVHEFNTGNAWLYEWTLPEQDGTYTLHSRARDRAGNLETPTGSMRIVVNRTVPGAVTGLLGGDVPEDSGGAIALNWELSGDDGGGAADVVAYGVERREGTAGPFVSLAELPAGTTAHTDGTATDGVQYFYRVVSVDRAGNRGVSGIHGPLLAINNTGGADTTPPEEIGSLNPIVVSQAVSLSWRASANSALDLRDILVDVSVDGGATWGISGPDYLDGGRIELPRNALGHLFEGLVNGVEHKFRVRVRDSSGNVSAGVQTGGVTPGSSAYVTVSTHISQTTTWPAGVYCIAASLNVNSGVTLTLDPGTIVKFKAGARLTINGALRAVGTEADPVVFTAWTDDEYGGDTNGDGASVGTPGYWDTLYFSYGPGTLEHAIVRFGGSSNNGNIFAYRSWTTLTNCVIAEGSSYGFRLQDASAPVVGNTFRDNGLHGVYLVGSNHTPTLTGNTITGNGGHGISSEGCKPVIDGNSIVGNGDYGIYVSDGRDIPFPANNTITGNYRALRIGFNSLPGLEQSNILSPNIQNQIDVYPNTRTRSVTLPAAVYYVAWENQTLIVNAGVTLTLQPGVIWKFRKGTRMDVLGALRAVGTAANEIVITSYRDDEYGGDSDDSGPSTGQPGDWRRIYFSDTTLDFLSRFEHAVIRYGGAETGNVYTYRASVDFKSCTISHSSSTGLYMQESAASVEGNTFADNGFQALYIGGGNWQPTIRNNTITRNQHGLYINDAIPTVDHNTITGNRAWGIYVNQVRALPPITGNTITGNKRCFILPADSLPDSADGNVFAPNRINGIWIRGNTRNSDLHFERLFSGTDHEINTYQIYDTLTMAPGNKLTVDPGVYVKFVDNARLDISGSLHAQGSAALPIVFTSFRDDEYGGDFNVDGGASIPRNGIWRGIYFTSSATDAECVLDYTVVRFGGGSGWGSIYSDRCDLPIRNSFISNSSGHGIRSSSALLTLTNCDVFANRDDGLRLEGSGAASVTGSRFFANRGDGIGLYHSSTITLSQSEVFGNVGYGLRNNASQTVAASGTWWGAVDGPGGEGGGAGDQVNANVTFDGFLTSGSQFSYLNAGPNTTEGTLAAPSIIRGADTDEWGSTADTRMLYDIDRVTVEYPSVDVAGRFDVVVTYYNPDNTATIGGNVQQLAAENGTLIHPSRAVPTDSPVPQRYALPATAYGAGGGSLRLNFTRTNGFRAVVSQIWLVQSRRSADDLPPTSAITTPADGDHTNAEFLMIAGTAADGEGSGIQTVEVGVDGGEGPVWRTATLRTSGGMWSYRWSLPAQDGAYLILSRARDRAGNVEAAGAGVQVTVNRLPPTAVLGPVASDTPLDGGGSIDVLWELSADDGAGANDVATYEVQRRAGTSGDFTVLRILPAGTSRYTDAAATDGVYYQYRVRTIDLAGNSTISAIYGPASSIDNAGLADSSPPPEATALVATPGNETVFLSWTPTAARFLGWKYAVGVHSFSSQYSTASASAAQATGMPDASNYWDFNHAWAPRSTERGTQFIELTYDNPTPITAVRVRKIRGFGFLTKIEARDGDGLLHTLWEGVDPDQEYALADTIFAFAETAFSVHGIRVTTNTSLREDWDQIDAVAVRPASPAKDILGQHLEVSADGGVTWGGNGPAFDDSTAIDLGKHETSCLISGLTNEQEYRFRIRTEDTAGNTSAGVTIAATPSTTTFTTISTNIGVNTTWAPGLYYVDRDIRLDSGITLTVSPGAIVKFAAGARLTVNGTMSAIGTLERPIVFTAFTDDAHGGDTNNDGDSSGTPGYWDMLYFANASSSASRLEQVKVFYGGSDRYANVYAYQSDMTAVDSEIAYGLQDGVYVNECAARISGNSIHDCGQAGVRVAGRDYTPAITGNTIADNRYGIYINEARPTIEGNQITGSNQYGLYCANNRDIPPLRNNTIAGNAYCARLPFNSLPDAADGNVFIPNNVDRINVMPNTLTRSLTLGSENMPPYYVDWNNSTFTVNSGMRLTLKPGVVWKLAAGTRFDVHGALFARGTAEQRIVFTSYRDDNAGGDSNGDGFSIGQRGDWRRIYLGDTVIDFLTRFENVVFKYGGGETANVYTNRCNVPFVSCEFLESASAGLYIQESSALIEGNTISDNNGTGFYLQGNNRQPTLRNNTITRNYHGLYVYDSIPIVRNNAFTDNLEWGLYCREARAMPAITGNTITGNKRGIRLPASALPNPEDGNILGPNQVNGVWMRGNTRTTDLRFGRLFAGENHEIYTYQVNDTITLAAGAKLTVDPGVVVKFEDNAGLDIYGALSATGTASAPVVFTSYRDDDFGGDFSLDGYGSSPRNGSWRGIRFFSSASAEDCLFDHVWVRYGGSNGSANVYSDRCAFPIRNSTIANSSTYGIYFSDADLVLTDTDVWVNAYDGILLQGNSVLTATGCRLIGNFGDGVEANHTAGIMIGQSELFANLGNGIRDGTSGAITATGNWWGAADGPGGVGPGSGDEVNGEVDYADFLAAGRDFSYFDAGGTAAYGFGIASPVVSGSSSTVWGGGQRDSFLYSTNEEVPFISVAYSGLAPGYYQLLLTVLNRDAGGGRQDVQSATGMAIQPPTVVPYYATAYASSVPAAALGQGSLALRINGLNGTRTIVSGLTLFKSSLVDSTAPTVTLTAPADGAELPSALHLISGTATDTGSGVRRIEIGLLEDGGQTMWVPASSLTGNGRWTYRWSSPADGHYSIFARAFDANGNQTVSDARSIRIDSAAPAPVQGLFAQGINGLSGVRLIWVPSADDGAGANDVSGYEVYRGLNRLIDFQLVGAASAGSGQYDDLTAVRNTPYWYFVRTLDRFGNHADTGVVGPVTSVGDLDTTPPEDVTNLAVQTSQVPGASPFAYLTWGGSPNTDGDLLDQRLYVSADGGATFGTNAPAFDNGRFVLLGRYTRLHTVRGLTNDHEYAFTIKTIDEVPNESPGVTVTVTPTGAAAERISLSGTVSRDSTLAAGVYWLSASLIVNPDVTLTLEPGTVVKFNPGRRLAVRGTLLAVGTVDKPIVFTAFTDDTHGGDTNGDGDATTPAPGYWDMVYFEDSGASASRLEHAVFRWGGSSWNGSVHSYRADVSLISCDVRSGSSYGMYLYSTSARVENCTIRDTGSHGLYIREQGTPMILGNTIDGNAAYGIYVYRSSPTIDGNTVTNNAQYGIGFDNGLYAPPITNNTVTGNNVSLLIPASAFPDNSNVLTPNTRNYIAIRGNRIGEDKRFRVWGAGTPGETRHYVVYTDNITVPAGITLTVDPGVTVKFSGNYGLEIHGALIAAGTNTDKITFTEFRDDSDGHDTNGNGTDSSPANGAWRGIAFYNSALEADTVLDHVEIRYGGGNGNACLYIDRADILVQNSEISNSSNHGIRLYDASPLIDGCRIWGNSGDGIRVDGSGSNPVITHNRISSNLSDGIEFTAGTSGTAATNHLFVNRGFALRSNSANDIDATRCWWGDVDGSGPRNATNNPTGTGGEVSDNVLIDPWRNTVGTPFAYRNFTATGDDTAGSLPAPILVQGNVSDEWDPSSKRPDRTMAWDADTVSVSVSGLDSALDYTVRVSYFSADAGGSIQRLTDGNDEPIHGPIHMPATAPVQYEFPIPRAYYPEGNLTLKFIHDNPDTSIRAAVPEIWLMKHVKEFTPPRLLQVSFNDMDGSGDVSLGDEYIFRFSEEMNAGQIRNGTTDANTRLPPEGGGIYGTVNEIRWTTDKRTLTVTITAGFTVNGSETVTPDGLTDPFDNAAEGTKALTTEDTIAPVFTLLEWVDVDENGQLSVDDQYVFRFSERMDPAALSDGTGEANINLRPAGGRLYGQTNTLAWDASGRALTLTVTAGYTILGEETVFPSDAVTDVAGNPVTGTHALSGRDRTPPRMDAVWFNDGDANGVVSVGDAYTFVFSEPMKTFAVPDYTAAANLQLSPAGKKYGNVNRVQWNGQGTHVRVTVTTGVTITGSETVQPGALLTDPSGNPVENRLDLHLVDTVAPRVASVVANVPDPVGLTDDFRLTVRFDTAVDPAFEPALGITGVRRSVPVVPAGGTWADTFYPNDTYTTPAITLGPGQDGAYRVDVALAKDPSGNEMTPLQDAFAFTVDATAPPAPAPRISALATGTATIRWDGYAPPADLAAFKIYLSVAGSFDTVAGLFPVASLAPNRRDYTFSGLVLDTTYHAAVVAVDGAGNLSPVDSFSMRIPRVIPPPVTIAVTPRGATAARVTWAGYDTAALYGFAGYRLFMRTSDFTEVGGLSAILSPGPGETDAVVPGLDRERTYFFAVVAVNDLGEFDPSVTTGNWSDPFAGVIDRDTMIGAEGSEVVIYHTMTVTANVTLTILPGTTLYFVSGAGIVVDTGALVAEGTALDPIVLTSLNSRQAGGTSAAGDWAGLGLTTRANNSILNHVVVEYGQGIRLQGAAPAINALTARYNDPAALSLSGAAALTTGDALLQHNATAVVVADSANLTLFGSVLLNNPGGIQSTTIHQVTARENWWGTTDEARILEMIGGDVDIGGFLDYEPLLTPAIATSSRLDQIGTPIVSLDLACRTAVEMRLSEDSQFPGAFMLDYAPSADFELSPGGGEKTIFAQFRSATGHLSDPVSFTLTYVTEGPRITDFNLVEGQVVNRPLDVIATATSTVGVARIRLHLDGQPLVAANGASLAYRWDTRSVETGIHRVKLEAEDIVGHVAVAERNLVFEILPPPAPVITEPTDGLAVNADTITVRGAGEPGVEVRITRNGTLVGKPVADQTGEFVLPQIALVEGENLFVAMAVDSVGSSSASNRVKAFRDSGPPAAVVLNAPELDPGGRIKLAWQYAETGERPTSFNLYRHTEFFSIAGVAILAAPDLTTMNYLDRPPSDGVYFYGLTGLDAAGNESELSEVFVIEYDASPPSFSIVYGIQSPVGVGDVPFILTSSEELQALPSLIFSPAGAAPLMTEVTAGDGLTYTGTFSVAANTPSGPVAVRASGRDEAGNYASGAVAGEALVVDTAGPVGMVVITPPAPIRTLQDASVIVALQLDEDAQQGATPQLRFLPPEGDGIGLALTGAGKLWSGTMTLTPAMGRGFGRFSLTVNDGLGNVGHLITGGEVLEIYNSDTPDPAPAPVDLGAVSRAGGRIELTWNAVSKADSYHVYRDPVGQGDAPVTRIAEALVGTSYADTPEVDGMYLYAVRSVRLGAESALSETVVGESDRTPPSPPVGLSVIVGDQGVLISWQAPPDREAPASYTVYRNDEAIRTGITALSVVDLPGVGGVYEYAVASADAIGNEARSASVSLNMAVGAVRNLTVLVPHDGLPELSWQNSDPNAVGFNLYRGERKINEQPVPVRAPSFTDTVYTSASRVTYTVRALNAAGEESTPRRVQVYPVALETTPNEDDTGTARPLVLNYLDTYTVRVHNRASDPLPVASLGFDLSAAGEGLLNATRSQASDVSSNLPLEEVFVAPCGTSVAEHVGTVTVEQRTDVTGSRVVYTRTFVFDDIVRPGTMIEVTTAAIPVAGAIATLDLLVHNRGYTGMDVVVNREGGGAPGDVRVEIVDASGLEIGRGEYSGSPSVPGKWILGDGRTLIRVPPGGSFPLAVDVLVPAFLHPDQAITFRAVADAIHHDLLTGSAVRAGPVTGDLRSSTTQTDYYGTAVADRDVYSNDQTVVISGQALARSDDIPLPNTDLTLGFATRGYHWTERVTTDGTGSYQYNYNPTVGLGGTFTIWAVHPDVVDQITQDTFAVYRFYANPARAAVRMSKNDTFAFSIRLISMADLPLTGLTESVSVYTVDDQGVRTPEPRVTGSVDFGSGEFAIGPLGERRIDLALAATADAPDTVVAEFVFTSAEGASATFSATVTLLAAEPVVTVTSPAVGYVEVSIDRGTLGSRDITVRNTGLRDLLGVELVPPANVPWMQLNRLPDENGKIMLGDLLVGQSKTFTVVFAPPADTEFGWHNDRIVLRGTEPALETVVNLHALVTSNRTGSVQFYVIDMLAQPVSGARIRMRNRALNREITPVTTGEDGTATVDGLQEGNWSYIVTASGYSSWADSVTVVPDQIVLVDDFFLRRDLVTIEFRVEPVPFTDRYEIKIEQTFETHLPVPTMRFDPPNFKFTDVAPGFETNFVATLHNEGLVEIEEVNIVSVETATGSLVPLISYVPVLDARTSMQIPFRYVYYGHDGPQGGGRGARRKDGLLARAGTAARNAGRSLARCLEPSFPNGEAINTLARGLGRCPAGNTQVAAYLLLAIQLADALGQANPFTYLARAAGCFLGAMYNFFSEMSGGSGRSSGGRRGGRGPGAGFGAFNGCPPRSRQNRGPPLVIPLPAVVPEMGGEQ